MARTPENYSNGVQFSRDLELHRWPPTISYLSTKRTRKCEFLDEMNRVVPWTALVGLIEPHYPKSKTGRPPMPLEVMLRVHLLQQWF